MASWRTLLWHLAVLPLSRARASTGSSRPASRAMMAMTTSSSIKVKACAGRAERRRCGWKAILISCETTNKKRADTPAYHNRADQSKCSELPLHARPAAFHQFLDLVLGRHRGVAGRRHRERAVRRAVIDRLLRIARGHEAVNEAARKTVAASDAVEDFEVRI